MIAALADAIQLGFFPVFAEGALSIPDDALDALVAALLLLTLGWQWRFAAALTVELIPGAALFPSWTACVMTMATVESASSPSALPA